MSREMTPRERFNAAINFEDVDHIPWTELGIDEYLFKWHREGLPIEKMMELSWTLEDEGSFIIDSPLFNGLDYSSYFGFQNIRELAPAVDLGPLPRFRTRILQEEEDYVRLKVESGAVVKYPKKTTGLDSEAGYARYTMPTFENYPVKNRESWEEYKKRFDPNDPRRYPKDWNKEDYKKAYKEYQEGPTVLKMSGFFGFAQRIMGVPNLIRNFYKKQNLIEDMVKYWKNFMRETLREVVETLQDRLDYVWWFEDMAEGKGPMISPDLYEDFLLPHYKDVINFLNRNGIDRVMMDSDGNIEPLLDLALEAGISGTWPLEANAGMDAVDLRDEYGEKLFLGGNIDKRKIVEGGEAMKKEVDSKIDAFEGKSGYFLSIDHAIPAECSLETFQEYVDYVKERLEKTSTHASSF